MYSNETCRFWKDNECFLENKTGCVLIVHVAVRKDGECCLEINLAGGIRLVSLGQPGVRRWGNQRERLALPSPLRNRVRTLIDECS